ncbi:MAG: GLPGLI family protein [Flavobacteriaceae bacterium]|nr:MAG: GLPGLI family protein [Flavobacteriaceae bacterium]
MKILNIIALFLFIGIKAQTSINGVVLYQETFKSTLGNVNSNYELYFNKNHSIYLFSGNSTQTETNSDGKFSKFIPQRSSDPPFYYKKLNKKEVFYNSKTALNQYTVKDDSLNLNWKIHKEKRIIGNYECSKATIEFRGRRYTVWFTSKIPVDYGPRKFSGLPGLILEIYGDKGVYRAYASEIKMNNKTENTEKVLTKINLTNPISYNEFLNKRCDDALEFKRIIESKMGRGAGRLKLTKVGNKENLEINTDECIK